MADGWIRTFRPVSQRPVSTTSQRIFHVSSLNKKSLTVPSLPSLASRAKPLSADPACNITGSSSGKGVRDAVVILSNRALTRCFVRPGPMHQLALAARAIEHRLHMSVPKQGMTGSENTHVSGAGVGRADVHGEPPHIPPTSSPECVVARVRLRDCAVCSGMLRISGPRPACSLSAACSSPYMEPRRAGRR
jgi:hypothetical protein